MRVLVTGVDGYIGAILAPYLMERGMEVVGLDTGFYRQGWLYPMAGPRPVTITKDLREVVQADFEGFDAVAHLAELSNDPIGQQDPGLTHQVNHGGSVRIANAAKAAGVKRFVYFQTALCYGLKPSQSPIRLDHPRNPVGSSYAISKTTNEYYIELSGVDFVTFRLANVVGPRNVAGPLPIFYQRLKDGKQCFVTEARRDFVYVKDLARVVLKAMDGVGHGAYHFSSGKDVAIHRFQQFRLGRARLQIRHRIKCIDLEKIAVRLAGRGTRAAVAGLFKIVQALLRAIGQFG